MFGSQQAAENYPSHPLSRCSPPWISASLQPPAPSSFVQHPLCCSTGLRVRGTVCLWLSRLKKMNIEARLEDSHSVLSKMLILT